MWTCKKCGRVFGSKNKPHSCKSIPLENHFEGKEVARDLFDVLLERIENEIGKVKIISIPCCIHLFCHYDFMAALPKKDRLEIRFVLNRKLDSPRLKVAVPLSSTSFKNCLNIYSKTQIDNELIGWLRESCTFKE